MLKAIIFDFDGVIANTEPLHCRAFALALTGLSLSITENEYFAHCAGLNDNAIMRWVLDRAGLPADETAIARTLKVKDRAYEAMIGDSAGLLLPGVHDWVVRAAGRLPLAICSGARRVEIDKILGNAGLAEYFRVVVSAEDVESSKPDPAGFIRTLGLLQGFVSGLAAQECLVIEDSLPGIAAAKSAGMKVLAVQTYRTAEDLSAADLVVPDLRSVADADWAEL